MMTLTVELPDEATKIPDLEKSISWFVNEQIKISRWRERRYSRDLDEIVDGAMEEAERLKDNGISDSEARAEFVRLCRQLAE